MWHGVTAPLQVQPFLKPSFFCTVGNTQQSQKAEEGFYVGLPVEHPKDSLRMVSKRHRITTTRTVTQEAQPEAKLDKGDTELQIRARTAEQSTPMVVGGIWTRQQQGKLMGKKPQKTPKHIVVASSDRYTYVV